GRFYCADWLRLNDPDYHHLKDDDCRRPADGRPGRAVRRLGRRDRERRPPDRRGRGWQTPGRDYRPDPDAHRSGGQQGEQHHTG
ncbi:hypothetical protein, partial [Xanthomonas axonopodis]|uniref:hypothetical protein n=1 Tax=Xanthomonas axonopodis TaxID=53413 RepID=UPI000B0E46C0